MTEQIHAMDATTVFTTFIGAPNFDVTGLGAVADDADGLVGEILFPSVGGELREDVVDASLGMPRDLNGDGAIDALNHADDYIILPITIRIRWMGVSGRQTADLSLLVQG